MSNVNSNALGNSGGRFYSFLNRPVHIDCNFVVDHANGNGLGIRNLKGSGVQNVYMWTTASPAVGNPMGQTASKGYALIQLSNNYNRYAGGFSGFVSPTTGSAKNIDATDAALTVGNPYIITSVGHPAEGAVTIAPVADVSGSLASTWFTLYDAYGNTFVIWFSVSGVGAAPQGLIGATLVQQSILSGATAAQIGAALVLTIENLPSGVSGVNSFTATGTTTVTATNTSTNPYHLPGAPTDGLIPTGFTFALSVDDHNSKDWMGVGLQTGVTPAIGAGFIAIATGFGKSTGQVMSPGISGITSIEVIGDPNQTLGPQPIGGSPNVGGWLLVQFLAPTSTSVTTLIPTAPADNSVVGMTFMVEKGSLLINGD